MTKVIRLLPWPERSKRMMRPRFVVRVFRLDGKWAVKAPGYYGFLHVELADALGDAWRFATELGAGIAIDIEDRV